MFRFQLQVILGIIATGLLWSASVSQATELNSVWTATYVCSNQQRNGTLLFVDENKARFDFTPGENSRVFPAGSFYMDIWRKGDEILLIGSEWLQQPRGFAMVGLRLTVESDRLVGSVEHKGCGEVTFTKVGDKESQAQSSTDLSTTLPDDAEFPLYYASEHQCGRDRLGSYWRLEKGVSGGLVLEMTQRKFTSAHNSGKFRFVLAIRDGKYTGQESKGSFGVSFQPGAEADSPKLQWLDHNGKAANKNCNNPVLTSAEEPKVYWQKFFDMADKDITDISMVKQAVHQYRTLPAASYLTVTDQSEFVATRDKRWKELQESYKKAMPKLVRQLPVTDEQERHVARMTVRKMVNPGFKHKLDLAQLYTDHLLKNGVSSESLYFTDRDIACERVRNNGRINSNLNSVTWFVGLPATEFDQQTTDEIIKTIEQCAEKDADIAKVSQRTLNSLSRQVPALTKENEKAVWLKEQAVEIVKRPANLETFISTNGYTLNNSELRKRRISNNLYESYFNANVYNARIEATDNAKVEIAKSFPENPVHHSDLSRIFNQCRQQLRDNLNRTLSNLRPLDEICVAETQKRLNLQLERLHNNLGKDVKNEEEIHALLATEVPNSLAELANSVGLLQKARDYHNELELYKRTAGIALQEKILQDYQSTTGNREVPDVCRDNKINRYIDRACASIISQNSAEQLEQRCDAIVDSLGIPEKYQDDYLIYGDIVSSEEIQVKKLVCDLQGRGVNLQISKNGTITGSDKKYGRDIFSSNISLVKDDNETSYWELKDMELKVDEPKLLNKPAGSVLACLITEFNC